MPREAFKCWYNPKTDLYRKRIKDPQTGKWIPLYDRDKAKLKRKYEQAKRDIEQNLRIKDDMTFAEYAVRWYNLNTPELSTSRKSDYKISINNHIAPVIGNMKIRDVKPDDVKEVLMNMSDMSYSMQVKAVGTLKQIFAAAEENNLIIKSPCTSLKPGGYKSRDKIPLNNEQTQALLEAVSGTSVYPFIMLGLYAGMRREEILGLQWDCVHLDSTPYLSVRRALIFESGRPIVTDKLKSDRTERNASRRDVPIPPQLVACLQKLDHKTDFILHNKLDEPHSLTSFRNMWRIVERRQLKDETDRGESKQHPKFKRTIDFHVTPHVLRHTYITNLILSGINIKKVQYLAGHANIKVTLDIYTKLVENRPQDLIGDIEKAFSGQNSGQIIEEITGNTG